MAERQTVLVAGATGSIGGGAAVSLAKRGAQVVVLGRTPDRLKARATAIRAAVAGEGSEDPAVRTLALDFSDMDSVRSAAAEALDRYPAIDGLVLSVGALIEGGPHIPSSIASPVGPVWEALIGDTQNHDVEGAREFWAFFQSL